MDNTYRLLLAAARAIVEEAARIEAAPDAEADFDPSDPSLLMNILLPKSGEESPVDAPASGYDDSEIDPHKSYDFDCPPLIAGLEVEHPANADYLKAWHDLSALYSEYHNDESDHPTIAKRTAEVWKAFLSLKQYGEDPQYGLIRDHLRAAVKPACAHLIALCAGGADE